MTDRRNFLALCAALGASPRVMAQSLAPRLGILRLSPPRLSYEQEFLQALREQGFTDGKNLTIVDLNAGGNPDGLPELAGHLVRLPVAVIFARGAQALAAAKRATDTIPIVAYDDTIDPVESRYAISLARPGGNVTGVFVDMPELVGKRLELLGAVVPQLARLSALWDPSTGTLQRNAVETAARAASKQFTIVEVRGASALARAFQEVRHAPPDALMILSSVVMRIHSKVLADFARQEKLAAVAPYRDFPEVGGLMSYGAFLPSSYQRCALQLVKMLRGARPADVPIERPNRYELILNASTAESLGITLSQSLLARADELIH